MREVFGKTFKFRKTGHPKISMVVGISGRTFEFPVERSKSGKTFKFRKTGHPKISVVLRISGRTFKIQKNGSSENFGHTPQKTYLRLRQQPATALGDLERDSFIY